MVDRGHPSLGFFLRPVESRNLALLFDKCHLFSDVVMFCFEQRSRIEKKLSERTS